MRLNKKVTSNKNLSLIFIVVLLVTGAFFGSAYAFHFWPFATPVSNTASPDKSEQNDNTPKPEVDNNDSSSPSVNPDNNSGIINPPLQSQPSNTEPFPIENERYKIVKNGEKSFDVTLYPIVNNPEYSNYTEQLRAYKNDVMTYLKSRYGSTSDLSINWNPTDAKNL